MRRMYFLLELGAENCFQGKATHYCLVLSLHPLGKNVKSQPRTLYRHQFQLTEHHGKDD